MTKQELQELGKQIAMTACPENGWNWRMIRKAIMDHLPPDEHAIADHEAKGIKAKALRKKGTDKWYFGDRLSMGICFVTYNEPIPYYHKVPEEIPPDAELVDIIILEDKP